jgi:hypothetical protein
LLFLGSFSHTLFLGEAAIDRSVAEGEQEEVSHSRRERAVLSDELLFGLTVHKENSLKRPHAESSLLPSCPQSHTQVSCLSPPIPLSLSLALLLPLPLPLPLSRSLSVTFPDHSLPLSFLCRSRDLVVKNNARLKSDTPSPSDPNLQHPPLQYSFCTYRDEQLQDQGFTRPKVLIVVPFRNAALEVVQCFLALTPKSNKVQRKKERNMISYAC